MVDTNIKNTDNVQPNCGVIEWSFRNYWILPGVQAEKGAISGSYGTKYENNDFLAYSDLYSHCRRQTFQRRILSLSSGQ
jgi:hypothetical protein